MVLNETGYSMGARRKKIFHLNYRYINIPVKPNEAG